MLQQSVAADELLETQWLKDRLARQEKGIVLLREVLKEEASRREEEVAERDRRIGELDHAIRDLQGQVLQRDVRIRDLEIELHRLRLQSQVIERDLRIRELQAELQIMRISGESHLKSSASDTRIVELQQQLSERDRQIDALNVELRTIQLSKLWPLVRLSGTIRRSLDLIGLSGR